MIVGDVWDVLDRLPVMRPGEMPLPPDFHERYMRLVETITILNQLFAKTKMETA